METKKAFKKDKIKSVISYCPSVPVGAIFLFGKIGSGKSLAMMTLAQRYHDYKKIKIFDMWGGERNQGENLYWTTPSQFKEYWNFWKKNLRLDKDVPKQYRVNLLYPLFKNIPKKLPKLKGFVFPIVFRIPIKQIGVREIKCVIGNLSSSDETLWEECINKLNKEDGCAELIKFFQKKNSTNTSLYKNFVNPLVEEGLLCSMVDEKKIDISTEMKDKDIVSVLAHHYIPSKFDVFIMAWLLFRIWDLSKDKKIPSDIIILIREASKFFRASDKSVLEDKYKIFKRYLDDFLRYARGKMHLFLDTQSPAETKGLLDGNQDISIIGMLPGAEDRQFATEQFKRDGCMVGSQVKELAELEPGEYFFVYGKGKLAEKKYLLLPRTMYWREKDGNFYEIFAKLNGNNAFEDSSEIYKQCIKEYRDRISELNRIENLKKEEKKEIQIKSQQEEEEKKEKDKLVKYRRELEEKRKIKQELKKQNKTEKVVKMHGDSEEVISEIKRPEKEETNPPKLNFLKKLNEDDILGEL